MNLPTTNEINALVEANLRKGVSVPQPSPENVREFDGRISAFEVSRMNTLAEQAMGVNFLGGRSLVEASARDASLEKAAAWMLGQLKTMVGNADWKMAKKGADAYLLSAEFKGTDLGQALLHITMGDSFQLKDESGVFVANGLKQKITALLSELEKMTPEQLMAVKEAADSMAPDAIQVQYHGLVKRQEAMKKEGKDGTDEYAALVTKIAEVNKMRMDAKNESKAPRVGSKMVLPDGEIVVIKRLGEGKADLVLPSGVLVEGAELGLLKPHGEKKSVGAAAAGEKKTEKEVKALLKKQQMTESNLTDVIAYTFDGGIYTWEGLKAKAAKIDKTAKELLRSGDASRYLVQDAIDSDGPVTAEDEDGKMQVVWQESMDSEEETESEMNEAGDATKWDADKVVTKCASFVVSALKKHLPGVSFDAADSIKNGAKSIIASNDGVTLGDVLLMATESGNVTALEGMGIFTAPGVKSVLDEALHKLNNMTTEELMAMKEDAAPDTDLGEASKAVMEYGFDLTDFDSAEDFQKALEKAGMAKETKKTKDGFLWSGEGIEMVTGNNPITGEYRDNRRGNEVGFASYIGITGTPAKVKTLVAAIKDVANYKDESPGARDFI